MIWVRKSDPSAEVPLRRLHGRRFPPEQPHEEAEGTRWQFSSWIFVRPSIESTLKFNDRCFWTARERAKGAPAKLLRSAKIVMCRFPVANFRGRMGYRRGQVTLASWEYIDLFEATCKEGEFPGSATSAQIMGVQRSQK